MPNHRLLAEAPLPADAGHGKLRVLNKIMRGPSRDQGFFEPLPRKASEKLFNLVHGNQLIYNSCWEDPRLDRQVLDLDGESEVVMITSAGCNALDYLLDGPKAIHAVDVNFRQNAVLELKQALISGGNFERLWGMFGDGSLFDHEQVFDELTGQMSGDARRFWKRKSGYFRPGNRRGSYYYRGASGVGGWLLAFLVYKAKPRLKSDVLSLFEARDLDEQRRIYDRLEPELWGRTPKWLIRRTGLLALLGVPLPQIELLKRHYPGGVDRFVMDKMRRVFTEISLRDNYFWRVFTTGSYTRACCPEYLKWENFETLQERVGRIKQHTTTVTQFLRSNPGKYSHFVLLDHQDWLASHDVDALREEWDQILANCRPGAKILLRTVANDLEFIPRDTRERLRFFPDRCEPLHRLDRVGTYGSMHLAEVINPPA